MIPRWLIRVRCWLAARVLERHFAKRYFVARLIAPPSEQIVRAGRPRRTAVPRPAFTHFIYHNDSIDAGCAANAIESVRWNIPAGDEVIVVDLGGSLPDEWCAPLRAHPWFSTFRCRTDLPEQRSFTYGLNLALPTAKAPRLFVWRTDYVYPRGFFAEVARLMERADFVAPYNVWIGGPHVTSAFVRQHWDRAINFDPGFWRKHSHIDAAYETQDPAIFGCTLAVWQRIGGMNHDLWGYGWQYAELAAQMRLALPPKRIAYFGGPAPLHQQHGSSLQHVMAHPDPAKLAEWDSGNERLTAFLGGRDAVTCYRLKRHLAPRPPD
jgi:hypothetical protein